MQEPHKEEEAESLQLVLDAQVDDRWIELVDLHLVNRVFERALRLEGRQGRIEASLVVGDDDLLCRLNATYRGIDAPTDVLSFPQQSPDELANGSQAFVVPPDETLRIGDVVVSYPRAQEQAALYGHSVARELAYLAVHGLLHLLGYDHENEADRRVMRSKEEAALAGEIGIGNVES